MQVPLDITFHNLDTSAAVTSRIRAAVNRLSRVCPDMISCRVVVELRSRRHQHGNLYKVSVDVRVPNAELVGGQHSGANPAHTDVDVAIRDAFDQMRRQLSAHAQQGQGKAQARTPSLASLNEESA